MNTTSDGFDLRLHVGTIEPYFMVKKGIFRYRVEGNSVERVQPIVINGRGFVDAWLQAPWTDAKKWTSAESIELAEKAHAHFAKDHTNVSYEYGPVRSCTMKDSYEVEIDREPGGPTFYMIKSGINSFTLTAVSKKLTDAAVAPTSCKSTNRERPSTRSHP
jgi:hypothetical protein